MSVAAYHRMRNEEAKNRAETEKKNAVVRRERMKEEFAAYGQIVKALRPYHNEFIDGRKVTVKNVPKDKAVEVTVKGIHWLTFRVNRLYFSCGHDYPCDCGPGTTRLSLDTIEHRKRGGDLHTWFPCGLEDLQKEDVFVHALAKVMDEFRYEWE